MSDLKHLSLQELNQRKVQTEKYISKLKHKINSEEQRLMWIHRYIEKKKQDN